MEWTLFQAVNGLAGHLDAVDDTLEFAARSLPLLLVPLLLALWFWPGDRADRDERQWACLVATAAASLALGLNQVIIRLWDRPRPFADHDVRLLLPPSRDPSFPSDHATFVFAVAVAILLVHRRAGIAALVLAIAVSFARVYVGEHYVGDVIAGAAIGAGAAVLVNAARPLVMPLVSPPLRIARRLHLG
jgi:undecaprenyl-diphosphatase